MAVELPVWPNLCVISGFSFVLLADQEEHYKNCVLFNVVQHHVVISLSIRSANLAALCSSVSEAILCR